MPRRGRELEKLVAAIERSLADDERTVVESPVYLRDKSSGMGEFDVVITRTEPHRRYVTAIECKDYAGLVGRPIVDEFKTKCDDAGVNKAVIVASRGFTKDALQKAQLHGIDCLTLEAATGLDWKYIYEVLNVSRRNVVPSVMYDCGYQISQPSRLWERLSDGSSRDLSTDVGYRWAIDRFRELNDLHLLPDTPGEGVSNLDTDTSVGPVERFFAIDAEGQEHQITDLSLRFSYEEVRSRVAAEFHTYGAPDVKDRIQMVSANLEFAESPYDIKIRVVESPDGSTVVSQDLIEKSNDQANHRNSSKRRRNR